MGLLGKMFRISREDMEPSVVENDVNGQVNVDGGQEVVSQGDGKQNSQAELNDINNQITDEISNVNDALGIPEGSKADANTEPKEETADDTSNSDNSDTNSESSEPAEDGENTEGSDNKEEAPEENKTEEQPQEENKDTENENQDASDSNTDGESKEEPVKDKTDEVVDAVMANESIKHIARRLHIDPSPYMLSYESIKENPKTALYICRESLYQLKDIVNKKK